MKHLIQSPVSDRRFSVAAISLFSAWLISFPYEGQILYAFMDRFKIDPGNMILGAITSHIIGLFSCGFFIKSTKLAKKTMQYATVLCIAGSCVFFFAPSAF
jgi:hypothetical protein